MGHSRSKPFRSYSRPTIYVRSPTNFVLTPSYTIKDAQEAASDNCEPPIFPDFEELLLMSIDYGVEPKSIDSLPEILKKRASLSLDMKIKTNHQLEQNLSCLIVDSDPINLIIFSHWMEEKLGFQIKTALNGEDAIQSALEQNREGKGFEVIIMACRMPIMDGYEASQVLKNMMKMKQIHRCPIFTFTAYVDEEHERQCREIDIDYCINVPFTDEKLEQMVNKIKKLSKECK